MLVAPFIFHEVIGSSIVVVIGRPGDFESSVITGYDPLGSHFEPQNIETHTELEGAVRRARRLAVGVRLGGMSARQATEELRAIESRAIKRRRKRAA